MDYSMILVSRNAKTNFIKGLIRLAKVDGRIGDEERNYFISAAVSMGLCEDEVAEINRSINSNECIDIYFETEAEKFLFFREGIQLCAIDGAYNEKEKAEIRIIATTLNVPQSKIQEIESWVNEGMAWRRRGDDLLIKNYNLGS